MAEARCPVCNTPNPENQENCLVCGARLRVTTEPLPPIRAGQEPTPKSTSELERTLPGWLRDLRSGGGEQQPSPTPVDPPQASQPTQSTPDDLLAGLSGDLFTAPSEEAPAPDFLSGLSGAAGEEEEEAPDWLKALQGSLPADTAPATDQPAQGGLSDWFQAEQEPETEGNGFIESLAQETPAPHEETSEEVADWLRSLDTQAPSAPRSATPAQEAGVPSSQDGESPDWLSELGGEAIPFAFVEPAAATGPDEAPPAETPDWLSAPGAEAETPGLEGFAFPAEEAPPAAPQTPASETDLPDWVTAQDEAIFPVSQEPPTQPMPESSLDGLDWLKGMGVPAESQPQDPGTFDPNDLPAWLSTQEAPARATAETPDWLSGGSLEEAPLTAPPKALAEEGVPPAQPPPAQAFLEDDSLPEIASAAEPFSMEMPDWLSGITPAEKPQPRQREAEDQGAPTLSPGELPSWVQSMRPVESILSDSESAEEEGTLEQKGPLAGLRNVLPLAATGFGIRKPPAYANKLSLDETQQAGASLLESIMAAETTARPAKALQRVTSARLLRWLIALVLIVAVAVPSLLNTQFAPSNTLLPPETLAAANQVGALQAGAPVLVVLDYEPGLSGELEAAAAPVIDHLMIQGMRLAFISTSPAGPLLTERLLGKFQGIHGYQPNQQYVNLGYLPGGPAGIAAFAAAPSAVVRYTITSAPAWETSALAGVSSFSDFAAVLVVTDSVDAGRAWIEQSGPALGQAPLLMAISAQAEPIIRPYYDAGQVSGLVTGLVGGAAYEQVIGKTGLGRQYWDALSASFLAAEVFIVAGSVWGLFAALRTRRKKQENDEALP